MEELIQVAHTIVSLSTWIIAYFIYDNPLLLLVSIFWNILVLSSWVVFDGCIVNHLEHSGDSDHAIIIQQLAELMNIPVEACSKGFMMSMFIAPTLFMMSRIAGALGL